MLLSCACAEKKHTKMHTKIFPLYLRALTLKAPGARFITTIPDSFCERRGFKPLTKIIHRGLRYNDPSVLTRNGVGEEKTGKVEWIKFRLNKVVWTRDTFRRNS